MSAWSLPVWMWLRYCWPLRFSGDQRESPAFAMVLLGLAVALLFDRGYGPPVYLTIYNLFLLLLYLFHMSAVKHPSLPPVNGIFPGLSCVGGIDWNATAAAGQRGMEGVLLLFLRGTFCADSLRQVATLGALRSSLEKNGAMVVLASTESEVHWQKLQAEGLPVEIIQLAAGAKENMAFVAAQAMPVWLRLAATIVPRFRYLADSTAVCRPSAWLLDKDGYVLWRQPAANYRQPAEMSMLRSQLFRLGE
ncbi:hypothetical protein [Microbulbifer sp. 2201CG32-9]|uniref:hypothetical protein n=1 Tax=unclassified Microbulbifer TaxID=2619833 RepID=UPI00345BA0EB